MRSAAAYLLRHTLRNRARHLVRQLRSPRYVVALLAGLAYLGFVFLGHRGQGSAPVPVGFLETGGTLVLVVLTLKWWAFGADRLALAFSPAEIQFLFPAPVTRPALLAYKLARAQLFILLNVFIWSVLLRSGHGSGPGRLLHAGSLWLFFSTISFHRLGVALTRSSVLEHGASGLRRALMPATLLLLGGTAVWLTLRGFRPMSDSPLDVVREFMETPPLKWILWPFQLPLLTFGATSPEAWFPRAGIGLGILALHLMWILRADQAFEEAAVEASARRAARLDRFRRHGVSGGGVEPIRRRWVPLAARGHPALAIAWKNLTRLARTVSPGFAIVMLLLLVGSVGAGLFTVEESPVLLTMAGTVAVSWTGILLLFGPLWLRADLRSDMDHLATLRTWPLSGQVLMAGQVLGSAVALTFLEALLGGAALLALHATGAVQLGGGFLGAAYLSAIPTLALINVLAVSLQNGGAILFPAWVRVEARPGGVEAMGQQLLTAGISLILLALLLAGPALLGGGLMYFLTDRLGPWAILAGLPLALLGLVLEAFLLIDWLGGRFEELDPSGL